MTASRHFCASALGLLSVLIVFLSLTLISYKDLKHRNRTLEDKLVVTPANVKESVLESFIKVEAAHKLQIEVLTGLLDEAAKRRQGDDARQKIQEEILKIIIQQQASIDPNNSNEITTGKK